MVWWESLCFTGMDGLLEITMSRLGGRLGFRHGLEYSIGD